MNDRQAPVLERAPAQREDCNGRAPHRLFATLRMRPPIGEALVARVAVGPMAFRVIAHHLAARPVDPAIRTALGDGDRLAVTIVAGFYATLAGMMAGAGQERGVPAVEGIEMPARARGTYAEALA